MFECYGNNSRNGFTTKKKYCIKMKLTLLDALDLLVIDGANRHAAPEDVANMMSRDMLRLLHDVAVAAIRAHVHGDFGTGQDGRTDSEAIADVGGGAELADVSPMPGIIAVDFYGGDGQRMIGWVGGIGSESDGLGLIAAAGLLVGDIKGVEGQPGSGRRIITHGVSLISLKGLT